VHQDLRSARQKAIVDEEILLDAEPRVATLEVSGAIVPDPMAQDQILRARRGADRVGLDKTEPLDRTQQRGRRKQRPCNGIAPQVFQ
jgi:hypothetical protein